MREGWKIMELGDVCDIQGGATPKRTESAFWENGSYPWFTIEDIRRQGRIITDTNQKITQLAWEKLRVFPKDTVLLCCTASIGEYAITKIPLTSNQQFNGLTVKDNKYLNPKYLMHYCATLKNRLLSLSGKATINFVSAEKIRQITIPIPPLPEQERIVAELDCLSSIIEKQKEQLKELDNLAQSIFYTMFGDPITNEKGWEVKTLGDMCDIINGFAFKSPLFTEDGDYILRISNIHEGYVDLKDVAYFHKSDYPKVNFEKYAVLPNDIVIALSGATTGKLGINKTGVKLYLNQRVAICREKNDKILREYLLYYLHEQSKKFLSDAAGVAQPNLSTEQMKEYKICVPTIAIQQDFASKIEAIEKHKELIKQSIAETETLFNSRMDYYFN